MEMLEDRFEGDGITLFVCGSWDDNPLSLGIDDRKAKKLLKFEFTWDGLMELHKKLGEELKRYKEIRRKINAEIAQDDENRDSYSK